MSNHQGKRTAERPRNRRKIIVGIVCGVVPLVSIALLLRDGGQGETKTTSPTDNAGREPVLVRYAEAQEVMFHDSVSADGELKSRFYAVVSPRIGGIIDDVFVREGDRVEQGTTKLFQVENEKLRQAAEHARQSLAIARSTLNEKGPS